jgi:hypothetical protein
MVVQMDALSDVSMADQMAGRMVDQMADQTVA